jgi:transposase
MRAKQSSIDHSKVAASIVVRRVRRQFDEPFKRTVVEQVERLGRSQSSVARSYELDPKVLRRWLREYGSSHRVGGTGVSDPVSGAVVAESVAMMELRKRLRNAEEENDILKKALGVFSRHQR